MMRRVSASLVAFLTLLCITLVAIGTSAQENVDGKTLKNPVPATPESIKAGDAVYQRLCKFCHGADAKGDGPMKPKGSNPPNLIDEKWDYGSTDGEIFLTILNGTPKKGTPPKTDMVPLKGRIKDPDVWNLVNYLRSLGPKAKTH